MIQWHRYKGVTKVAKWLFFYALNRTNILRNMILKRLFLILPPANLRKTLTCTYWFLPQNSVI